ncbi:MAG: DUF2259 domain-containing protein [Oricola sp.]
MDIRYTFACLIGAATALAGPAAQAGDVATLNILGFSADATTFAFEEYGVQDGSGFPYANRFYIDTTTDNYMAGSPIRVRIDDETASVNEARAQAKTAGEAIIADSELEAHKGFTAGYNAITEISADPFRMVVNPRPVVPMIGQELDIRLEEIAFPAREPCIGMSETSRGFRLTSVAPEPGGAITVLHADSSVPASRGCTSGYRIGGVQSLAPFDGPSAYAVLIAVETFGFEGPDYRWMAVTRLSGQ